jgi:plasmid stabilization system protein ParE
MVKVVWDNLALRQLEQAFNYIKLDSIQNATRVKNDILSATGILKTHPEKYPTDKYKLNNDGTYRAFEKHRYRVAYRVLKHEIRILTLRHASMEPLEY